MSYKLCDCGPLWSSVEVRFWSQVKINESTGCWEWQAGKSNGYGRFYTETGVENNVSAYVWSYRFCIGDVPDGLVLDHTCRNKACINPWHLEPVTQKENCLRGVGVAAKNAAKTHCKKGHTLSGDNVKLYRTRRGHIWRVCKICTKVRNSLRDRRLG